MTIETINIGNYANDGTGDDLRTAFEKVNANFSELTGTVNIVNGANVGAGAGIFAQRNEVNLEFRTITSIDESITITENELTVDLSTATVLENDPSPTVVAPVYTNGGLILTNPFNLNQNTIINGDAKTTVYGYDIPVIVGLLESIVASQSVTIDMGSIIYPTGGNIDFNGTGNISFNDSADNIIDIDFGTF